MLALIETITPDTPVTIALVVSVVTVVVSVLSVTWSMNRALRNEIESKYVRMDLFLSKIESLERIGTRIERALERMDRRGNDKE